MPTNETPTVVLNKRPKSVDIHSIQAHPDNPRQGDIGAIVTSIKANGFYGFVVVQLSSGNILKGNHTWQAAKFCGMTTIPAVYVDVDDERALQILLADNRSSDLATYDDAVLSQVLMQLANGPGLEGTLFDGDDLDDILGRLNPPELEAVQSGAGSVAEVDTRWWPLVRVHVHPDNYRRWQLYAEGAAGGDAEAFVKLLDDAGA